MDIGGEKQKFFRRIPTDPMMDDQVRKLFAEVDALETAKLAQIRVKPVFLLIPAFPYVTYVRYE